MFLVALCLDIVGSMLLKFLFLLSVLIYVNGHFNLTRSACVSIKEGDNRINKPKFISKWVFLGVVVVLCVVKFCFVQLLLLFLFFLLFACFCFISFLDVFSIFLSFNDNVYWITRCLAPKKLNKQTRFSRRYAWS